ncbi:LysE family transporter [Cellulomonas septica]|uniref:LysE family transporter n=1 Tax=Cellulomonas septica TaxID=285080 RepID=A0ABX1JXU5_9CELL|nr:LysE family transporter [Cellulomonas septica]NKY38882.1 LysE family transporter [Cellulomonas septica]
MSLSLWLALVGACLVISLTPGAGAINTMANSLGSGWARSIWGILGQQAALVLHVAIVAAGVGALVSRSHTAFEIIRYVGAAYLVYLGVRQFRARPGSDDGATERVVEGVWPMFRRGLLVNLTNPKAIVFFLAFVPQFVRPDRPLVPQYAVLVATVVAVDVLVMWCVFAPAARGLARVIAREDGRRVVNRVFGGLFVGVGVLLATV